MRFFYVAFILVFAIACSDSKQETSDQTTTVFSYYLKTAFGDSIRNEKHTYVLIPKMGCKGCREDALRELQLQIVRSGKKNITCIFSPAVNLADTLLNPGNLLVDTSELIDKINLPISNIAILKTERGKVISLQSIRSETTDSIGFYLNQ